MKRNNKFKVKVYPENFESNKEFQELIYKYSSIFKLNILLEKKLLTTQEYEKIKERLKIGD